MNISTTINTKIPTTQALALFGMVILYTVTGISVSYALNWPIWLGFIAGLIAGAIPVLLPLIGSWFSVSQCMRGLSFLFLVAICGVISVQALLPLLSEQRMQLSASIPLLLLTVAQYLIYLLMSRSQMANIRNTSVISRLTFLFSGSPIAMLIVIAIILTTYTLLLLNYIGINNPNLEFISDKFLKRGLIPPLTTMLFFTGVLLLVDKLWMLLWEKRMLDSKQLNPKSILIQTYKSTTENQDNLNDFLDLVEKKHIDFYILPQYINWAIPILGFIGTVLGISLAAEGILQALNQPNGVSELVNELKNVIAPIGIAFDTTLIALSLSLVLQFLQTLLQRWEKNILTNFEHQLKTDKEVL